jgi:chromosome segregation ATPase
VKGPLTRELKKLIVGIPSIPLPTKKCIPWNISHLSQVDPINVIAMQAVFEATRELQNIQDAYIKQKDEYDREMDALTRKEHELRNKDVKFQESLIKFNKFLQENENKRYNATRRKSQEETQISQQNHDINNLKSLIEQKRQLESELYEQVEANIKYKTFLSQVVELSQKSSGDFSEIQHILDRYATLKYTNDELHNRIQNNTREHEARRFKYAQFMKKSGNEILRLNNDIARYQKELELISMKANKSIEKLHGASRNNNDSLTELTRAMYVITHIKNRLLSENEKSTLDNKKNVNKMKYRDVESKVMYAVEELQVIGERLEEFQAIVHEHYNNPANH